MSKRQRIDRDEVGVRRAMVLAGSPDCPAPQSAAASDGIAARIAKVVDALKGKDAI